MSRALIVLAACVAMAGCNPPTPSPPPSSGVEQINGTERLGWDQRASTAVELATFRYNVYVDNTPTEMQSVSCGDTPGAAGFACSARLPQMSAGQHTLALTSFIDAGVRLESGRSGAITVNLVPANTIANESPFTSITTVDGISLNASTVADGLREPTDLAVTPDGRIFIAERAGRIRVFRDGRVQDPPAAMLPDVVASERRGLMAIAIGPDYPATRHLFAIYTAADGWRIARFRAVADTLGERAVLVDRIDAPLARPSAALRFGPDGKLYAGLDDAGDPVRPGDAGSFNGKILRFNPDGTTPADQGWSTPVYAMHVNAPRAIAWDGVGATMWVVEPAAPGGDRLEGFVSLTPAARRGTAVIRYALPGGTGPSAAVMHTGASIPAFAGNLLIAADEAQSILRLRFDPAEPTKIVSSERLLRGAFGGIRALAVGPDGTIYFCTADSLAAVVAQPVNP